MKPARAYSDKGDPHDDDFDVYFARWEPDLRSMANSPRHSLPQQADAYAELASTFWYAYLTWKPSKGFPFGMYFYYLWRSRRASLWRDALREKRTMFVTISLDAFSVHSSAVIDLASMVTDVAELAEPPLPVHGIDPFEQVVWTMLCRGSTPKEIKDQVPISNRRYYRLIKEWKEVMQ